MKKRLFFSACSTIALLVFFSSQSTAAIIWQQGAGSVESEMQEEGGRIRIGKLKVVPGLRLSGVYDDNIYLGNGYTNNPNNPGTTVNGQVSKPVVSDYIFHVMPGLMLQYDMGERGDVNLGYLGDWAFYRDYTVQNWNMQTAFFNFNYTAPAGLIFKLSNIYTNGNDPYGDATQFGLGYTQRRWTNDLKAELGWDFFNRFRILGYYEFYKQKYSDQRNATQDWTQYLGGLSFDMRILPKTWAFVQFDYKPQDYDDSAISSSNDASNKKYEVFGGLKWDGGGKLGGQLGLGWEWLDYNNDVDPAGVSYQNHNTWMAQTSISYAATATTSLAFNLNRGIQSTGAASNEYYDDTQVGINVTQDLPYKFSGNAGFIYGRNDYNTLNFEGTEDRVDNNYNANVGITYKIRSWLDTSLRYRYMKKDSNDETQGFTDNQVMLSVGVSY